MKRVVLLLIVVLPFFICHCTVNQPINNNRTIETNNFKLGDCYHYWYGVEDSEINNYVFNRLYLQFSALDSIWLRKVDGTTVLHKMQIREIERVIYKDSIFLDKYRAYVSPVINLAPVTDNYYYLDKGFSQMTRTIKTKVVELDYSNVSVCVQVGEQKTAWLDIKKVGAHIY